MVVPAFVFDDCLRHAFVADWRRAVRELGGAKVCCRLHARPS